MSESGNARSQILLPRVRKDLSTNKSEGDEAEVREDAIGEDSMPFLRYS